MTDELYQRGQATRRAVLGPSYVERKREQTHDFDADFQRYLIESSWGQVWSREGLDLRTRSLVTIAILATLRHDEELELHLRATRNTGATAEEIKEMLLHVAAYAGLPAAHHATRIAKKVLAEFVEGAA
ncbi:MAG: 4-carboxymuconolactone decarboxylase [Geminicoccaceae bacterium]|nr:MAG: 4-carboxymuconolactone decarboxylase [Geminicoccaceae bacterium]